MIRAFVFILMSLSVRIAAENFIDFERDMLSDFVIETKQIFVPGFPNAYNPSIVPWKDGYLMSFRTGETGRCPALTEALEYIDYAESFLLSCLYRNPQSTTCASEAAEYEAKLLCRNQIGLAHLNANFEPMGAPHILYIHYPPPMLAERQHDPRIVFVGPRLFIVYSNMINGKELPEIRRPFIAELFQRDDIFFAGTPLAMLHYEGEDPKKWSKNWVPFAFDDDLNLSHQINPHIVFRFNGTMAAETVAKTQATIKWDFGSIRGGTPAILDDDGQYLAFFHSSIKMPTAHSAGKKIPHYMMGAYTFSAKPPFSLTGVSRVAIVGRNFFHGPIHKTWKPVRVVFPGGLVIGREKIWVAYGRQDHEIWIATLDKTRLRQSLLPL